MAENEATKVLQELLGLSSLAGQLSACFKELIISDEFKKTFTELIAKGTSQGLKQIIDDETYFGLLINILGDSLVHFLAQLLNDPQLEDKVKNFCVKAITDDNVKGVLAHSVYQGSKRLTQDGEAQKSLATVANLIVTSQPFLNTIDRAIEQVFNRNKELLTSPDTKKWVESERSQLVASLQDCINLSLSESAQELKNLRFVLSVNANA